MPIGQVDQGDLRPRGGLGQLLRGRAPGDDPVAVPVVQPLRRPARERALLQEHRPRLVGMDVTPDPFEDASTVSAGRLDDQGHPPTPGHRPPSTRELADGSNRRRRDAQTVDDSPRHHLQSKLSEVSSTSFGPILSDSGRWSGLPTCASIAALDCAERDIEGPFDSPESFGNTIARGLPVAEHPSRAGAIARIPIGGPADRVRTEEPPDVNRLDSTGVALALLALMLALGVWSSASTATGQLASRPARAGASNSARSSPTPRSSRS